MIIKEFNLGDTKILVDDTYIERDETKKEGILKEINRIAYEIIRKKAETNE